MITKLQMGYRLGFEIAIWRLQTTWGLIKWAVSPAWWRASEPDLAALAGRMLPVYRAAFTLGTLLGFTCGRLAMLLSPKFTVKVGLDVMEPPEPSYKAVAKQELIH